MQTLKYGFEKPLFIWLLIAIIYSVVFWTTSRHHQMGEPEQAVYNVIEQFSQSSFPPKIGLVREVPDWGHLAYYALFSRVYVATSGDLTNMRLAGLLTVLAALFVFVRLGAHVTYRNRLSPVWVSLATLVLAANPYLWMSATYLHFSGLLLLFIFLAVLCFEKEHLMTAACFLSLAVLVDWHALLIAIGFVAQRLSGEHSRLVRPERLVAFLLPFVIGALPLLVWKGFVPQGQLYDQWVLFLEKTPRIRLDSLFYAMAALPIYTLFYSWAWAFRARARALVVCAVGAAIMVPLYFIFPIRPDYWAFAHFGQEVPVGLLDQAATLAVGPYKNLLLFVPWIVGAFIVLQIFFMDVLERSRWMRWVIVLFFITRPFVVGAGDFQFLYIVPFVMLLSLSEALVGEEGKLA